MAAPASDLGVATLPRCNGYLDLLDQIRLAGLMKRRQGYFAGLITFAVIAFAASWLSVVLLSNSWWQLLPAAALGLICSQFGFLGHDAAHRQMFTSNAANAWTARVLSSVFAGLSYGWWLGKHSLHHRGPNQEGVDPDIRSGVLAFTPAVAATRSGLAGRLTRFQGWAFFPLLTLEGLSLHFGSVSTLLENSGIRHRRLEFSLVAIRLAGIVIVLLLLLPVGKAAAFIAVQLAVFGVVLGGSFAPNHKGMPILPARTTLDFVQRQVLTSRNISGRWPISFLMGGLNFQIEHHLFPSMPRPNLRRARPFVRAHCAAHGISYTETSLWRSYAIVFRYLNEVGSQRPRLVGQVSRPTGALSVD
jgi:fatty acid desaturase